jgi:hypothetical protein
LSTKRLMESASPRQFSFCVPFRVALPPDGVALAAAEARLLAGGLALLPVGVAVVPVSLPVAQRHETPIKRGRDQFLSAPCQLEHHPRVHTCMHAYIFLYIYIYTQREREVVVVCVCVWCVRACVRACGAYIE